MSRAAHPNGRGAVVRVLSALLLLLGTLGAQAQVSDPLPHGDLHRTVHLDLGTLAIGQGHRAVSHPQRADGQPMVMLPTRHESTHSGFAAPASARMPLSVAGACPLALRGRAPPA
jgi:hypothetical protein